MLVQLTSPLVRFFRTQVEAGLLTSNPTDNLRPFLPKRRCATALDATKFFRSEEVPQLLATCESAFSEWYSFLVTLLGTGLRWGEAAALQSDDLDLAQRRLWVRRTLSDGTRLEPPKEHEVRRVSLLPEVVDALQPHLAMLDRQAR